MRMRKVREVLRLVLGERLSRRRVGAAVGLPYTTVTDYVDRARRAGIGWPLPESIDDRDLEARLVPVDGDDGSGAAAASGRRCSGGPLPGAGPGSGCPLAPISLAPI